MKLVLYTNSVSPHQLPLARELAKQFDGDEYRYIYTTHITEERQALGWGEENISWLFCEKEYTKECRIWLKTCEILISGIRDISLFEYRASHGCKTLYVSERWFKPRFGMFRLLHPSFFIMAWRFVKLLSGDNKLVYLPIGIHAARDMARLCGLYHGVLKCLFRAPDLVFHKKPGGRIWVRRDEKIASFIQKFCLDKMRIWGYFVEEGARDYTFKKQRNKRLRVLWVGRLLGLKRVDTIIQAVIEYAKLKQMGNPLHDITLDIYGTGPEEIRLRKEASNYGDIIKFHSPVNIEKVRNIMRQHDVYVLASNAYEGWGAVVSEALEEGIKVIGTYEAGSSATILPESNLFHAGDWECLLEIFKHDIASSRIGHWTVKFASNVIKELYESWMDR